MRAQPRHVVCRRCGLVYMNPRPRPAQLASFYEAEYWEGRRMPTALSRPSQWSERAEAVVSWTKADLDATSFVLEIGCGAGENLARLKQEVGCRLLGLEPSLRQAQRAAEAYGVDVVQTTWEEAEVLQPPNLIVMTHVLEHFHNPRGVLEKCHRVLTPEGRVYIEVPNILNPNPRKNLRTWLAPEHLYYFSARTLSRLLQETGFRVLRLQEDVFVRVLAIREPRRPEPTAAAPSEYLRVWLALLLHEGRYWPRRVFRRLRSIR